MAEEITLTESSCCELPPSLRLDEATANDWAGALKALGHPVRLQIVDLLSRYEGQICVCDIESQFALSQPTISHHLRILREAGIVVTDQRSMWVFYHINPLRLAALRELLQLWTPM